jgi:hypothetical protein
MAFVAKYPNTQGPYYVIAGDFTTKVLLQQPEDGSAATGPLGYRDVVLSAAQLDKIPTVG